MTRSVEEGANPFILFFQEKFSQVPDRNDDSLCTHEILLGNENK